MERLSEAKRASDRSIYIERELIASKREISVLQKAVVDIKNALVQERKINLKLQTDNDKLRVSVWSGGLKKLVNIQKGLFFENLIDLPLTHKIKL